MIKCLELIDSQRNVVPIGECVVLELNTLEETQPTTTVAEAKKLLGRKYSHLTDDQVQDIIISLTLMARRTLSNSGSKKHELYGRL